MLNPRNTITATFLLLACGSAQGKNIDLVTLPTRNAVQLTIYNSEDLTLAKETREITLKKGKNQLQFSWSGTLIDPTSVELRPLAHVDQIDIVDTVLPGQKQQHLIWNIQSDVEGQVPVEVSYFTSGLTWQMDYVAIADAAERQIDFRGFVRVANNSGEEYENAEVRLIVGKINLVQKIAELAKSSGVESKDKNGVVKESLRSGAVRELMDFADVSGRFDSGLLGDKPVIVKEGVSEYFMFSVEGRETIRNGWSKRMQAVHAENVDFEIVYRQRTHQYGPRPVRFFIWENSEASQLGESPLPNGVVRVFRQNGREGLSFLGQQSLNYVPIMDKVEVNLGADDLVTYQRRRTKTSRRNFSFHPTKKIVIGWDEEQSWVDQIRNDRATPIAFELRLQIDGDVEFSANRATRAFDYRTVETTFNVSPSDTTEYKYTNVIHHGSNRKQNRIQLKPSP